MSGAAGPGRAAATGSGVRGDRHRQALVDEVRQVLARLDAHAAAAGRTDDSGLLPEPGYRPDLDRVPGPERRDESVVSALDTVCACFGLTAFERALLVLAAAVEVEPTAAGRCAAAGHPDRPYPTFGLALAVLPDPHWDALPPAGPLRRWHLLQVGDGAGLTTAPLRIDERILHFLAGVSYLDVRLSGLVRPVDRISEPPLSHQDTAAALAGAWASGGPVPVELTGADPQTRREITAAAAAAAGLTLYEVRAADLPGDAAERDRFTRLWEREAILLGAALLVDAGDAEPAARAVVASTVAALSVPVVVSSAEPAPSGSAWRPGALRLAALTLTPAEQRALWTVELNGSAGGTGLAQADLGRLVAQFSLPAHAIRSATAAVRRQRQAGEPATAVPRLAWQAGLAEARLALDELGRRIEPRARWSDLVLPAEQLTTLRETVAHVRQRTTVHQDWGFEAVLRHGLGVTALFAGGSGTGKTLAAEVIAAELGLDLFVIDLSQVISKYIGETEKNLRRVFDAAERGGAVLLFDEADALFGKRSEVKDSHDRYANIEVSYLLMRMEAYRGLAVLTTNMRKALDPAFLRRLRFVVEFPFPGVPERAEIWRRMIPDRAPTDGLDHDRLAQLGVAGGGIRNIALAAAFLAADAGEPIRMRHVLAAATTELRKTERAPTPAEVAGWE